jgi:dipeptidyl aminopeptidase/acylaminoacyl peptidase
MRLETPMHEPGQRPELVQGEDVELAGDGAVLPGRVFRPLAAGRRPAVVVAPGGQTRGSVEATAWLSARLAVAGYAALSITWRASCPLHDPRDVAVALDWLEQDPGVDARRLAVAGHSRGAMSALRTAAGEPRIQGVIALGTPWDLAYNVRSFATYAPQREAMLAEWLGGRPDEVPEVYATVSAVTYADRIHQPVILIHGTSDMTPPVHQVAWIERALREAGNAHVQVELIPGMGHHFELGVQGYQFDRVASLVSTWLAAVLSPA